MKEKDPLFRLGKSAFKIILYTLFLNFCCSCRDTKTIYPSKLFEYDNNIETRWSSPENPNGIKGNGGRLNNGAKGHAYDSIGIGQSRVLLDIQAQGIINRIWVTINNRSPEILRSLKIEMFWDNEAKPAVSVPFGDFFGVGLGKTTAFQNALFANAEGRSFNCFIPMPFKKGAKIVVTNESPKKLAYIFFDVDYSLTKTWNEENMYFHTYWHRDTATQPGKDFEILPKVSGRGRFLGSNIGVSANLCYKKSWFGEGEVKMYIDGENEFPTLVGTGTEDFIGTAWGQGKYINSFTGCTVADDSLKEWAFYRFHIPDPIFFKQDIRTTLQQIGGDDLPMVASYQKAGAPLIPVSTDDVGSLTHLYTPGNTVKLDPNGKLKGWTNFYRSDDVSATAYFYLDKPSSNLPAIQMVDIRTKNLRHRK